MPSSNARKEMKPALRVSNAGGPAVRLDIFRPHTAHRALDVMENQNARRDGASGRFDCAEPLRRGRYQESNADRTPEPAIARTSRSQHPPAEPARRSPAIDSPHQAVIRRRKSLLRPCECHSSTALSESELPSGSIVRFLWPQYHANASLAAIVHQRE